MYAPTSTRPHFHSRLRSKDGSTRDSESRDDGATRSENRHRDRVARKFPRADLGRGSRCSAERSGRPRTPLLRHSSALRPRASRAAGGPRGRNDGSLRRDRVNKGGSSAALRCAARRQPVLQGRAVLQGRSSHRPDLGFQLQRDHDLRDREPWPARPRSRRHAASSRSGRPLRRRQAPAGSKRWRRCARKASCLRSARA